jgi:exonuclease SbcC
MKPHILRFAGLGAYPDVVEIDFDQVGALGLYLIVGPTGAGKTTIFDAITFALFGKVAGDRQTNTLVSDHGHRVAPFAELEFTHRGGRYTVHREPAAPGKNTKTGAQWIVGTNADGVEIMRITGTKDVTAAVSQLIGLEADQFLRVMLLPQNEFQKFLLANSRDKQDLLRALFGTEFYERVAAEMAASVKVLREQADAAAARLSGEQAKIEGALSSLVEQELLDPERFAEVDPSEITAELTEMSAAAATIAATAAAAQRTATEARATGTRDAERFDAGTTLAETVAEREARRPEVAIAAAQIARADRARRASQALSQRDMAVLQASAAVDNIELIRAELVTLLDDVDFDAPWLEALCAAACAESFVALRREVTVATERVTAATSQYDDAATATETAARLEAEEREAADALAALQKDHAALVARLATVEVQLMGAHDAVGIVAELDRQVRELDDLLAAACVEPALVAMAKADKVLAKATKTAATASTALDAAIHARTRHLAGVLADGLADGDPCPVCGSAEHPAKAPLSEDADIDLEALAAARDQATGAMVRAQTDLQAKQSSVEQARAAAAQLPPEEVQQALRAQLDVTRSLADSIAPLRAEKGTLATDAEKVADEIVSAVKAARSTADARTRLLDQAAAKRATAAAVVAEVDVAAASGLLGATSTIVDKLEAAVATADRKKGEQQQAIRYAIDTLAAESFADEQDVAAALLDDSERDKLDQLVVASEQADELIVRLQGVIGDEPLPKVRPDLDSLSRDEETAVTAAEAAAHRATALAQVAMQVSAAHAAIVALGPDVAHKAERAQRAAEMSKILSNGEGRKLGLERWVQRAAFEEVCEVASTQIQVLSRGRYVLTLESDGTRKGSRSEGLDLYVTDGQTGMTRPVQSLSGGEQFLTSLALALALAEVVQRYSGGIELSTLFIDEGFGSLDMDSLDTAVDVLRSLQDSGRTVGVISHVEAMRSELPVGISVVPSAAGSRIEVLVAAA